MASNPPRDRPPPPAPEQPPWPPIQPLESDGPPSDRRPPLRPPQIVVATVVALGFGALLGSGALVGLAERQPLSTQRDVALGAAKVADRVAHGLSLNRPAERLASALDGEEAVYDVEALIARAQASAARTTDPQPPLLAEDPETEPATSPAEPEPPPVEPEDAPDAAEPEPSAPEAAEPDASEPDEPGEVDPDAGPPPDGFITPIEGVDCVAEDATAPTTTTDGGSEPPEEPGPDEGRSEPEGTPSPVDVPGQCPPGFVLSDPSAEPDGGTPEPPLFDAPRTPDADQPLQMYVGGDSISRDLGEGLARITPAALVRIDLDPRPATGLSRPDFFDWAHHLAGILTESRPDVIVVLFGANDFQNVEHEGEILDRFGDEWLELYRERVSRIMTLLSQPETQTVWVGQPPVREPRLSGGLERLNTVYAELAAEYPQVTYVDTWQLFSDSEGGYVDEIDDIRLRREDGVHLTIDGGNRLAEGVWGVIGPAWGLG
ncbi:MAG: DUF459 domain-containing protein [bacterium]|nr:DUF459 domain-containing protein [bacterium]